MADAVVPATAPVEPAGAAGGQAQPQNQEEKPGITQLLMKVRLVKSRLRRRQAWTVSPFVPGAELTLANREGRGGEERGRRCSCVAGYCVIWAPRGLFG